MIYDYEESFNSFKIMTYKLIELSLQSILIFIDIKYRSYRQCSSSISWSKSFCTQFKHITCSHDNLKLTFKRNTLFLTNFLFVIERSRSYHMFKSKHFLRLSVLMLPMSLFWKLLNFDYYNVNCIFQTKQYNKYAKYQKFRCLKLS